MLLLFIVWQKSAKRIIYFFFITTFGRQQRKKKVTFFIIYYLFILYYGRGNSIDCIQIRHITAAATWNWDAPKILCVVPLASSYHNVIFFHNKYFYSLIFKFNCIQILALLCAGGIFLSGSHYLIVNLFFFLEIRKSLFFLSVSQLLPCNFFFFLIGFCFKWYVWLGVSFLWCDVGDLSRDVIISSLREWVVSLMFIQLSIWYSQ